MFAEPFWVPSPHLIVRNAEIDHRLASHDVEVFGVPPGEALGMVGGIGRNSRTCRARLTDPPEWWFLVTHGESVAQERAEGQS